VDFSNREKERKDKLPWQTVDRLSGPLEGPVETYNCLNLSGFLTHFLLNPPKKLSLFRGCKGKNYFDITNVRLGNLNNSSQCGVPNGKYSDYRFSSTITDLNKEAESLMNLVKESYNLKDAS